jgi:hypothetical protein
MGGSNAPGDTTLPADAIAAFAAGKSPLVGDQKTGVYFDPQGIRTPHNAASNVGKQEEYMKICEQLSGGIKLP